MKNKILCITIMFLISFTLFANISYPRQRGWVNDYAGKLSRDTQRTLLSWITEAREKIGFELAIVIVPNLQGEDEASYATNLYSAWGIGSKDDEGVLILIAVSERKIRIETGYGVEGFITDGRAGEIIDRYMLPFLSSDNYNDAVLNATAALLRLVAQEKNVRLTGVASFEMVEERRGSPLNFLFLLFFLSFFFRGRFFPMFLLFGGMRGGFGRTGGFGGSSRGSIGGFGGFGGFGGGRSGGGGAGRSF